MNAQTSRIEARSVLLPRGAPWRDEFLQEISSFPASRQTDQIDALFLSQALNYAFKWPRHEFIMVGMGPKVLLVE